MPDISAQALDFAVVFNDEEFFAGGTSCAAPVRLSFLHQRCIVLLRAHS